MPFKILRRRVQNYLMSSVRDDSITEYSKYFYWNVYIKSFDSKFKTDMTHEIFNIFRKLLKLQPLENGESKYDVLNKLLRYIKDNSGNDNPMIKHYKDIHSSEINGFDVCVESNLLFTGSGDKSVKVFVMEKYDEMKMMKS